MTKTNSLYHLSLTEIDNVLKKCNFFGEIKSKQPAHLNLTDDEVAKLIHDADALGLDANRSHIRIADKVSRKVDGKWISTIKYQYSVDAFRLIAQRQPDFGGVGEAKFTYGHEELMSCSISIIKWSDSGKRYVANYGVALTAEYMPDPDTQKKEHSFWQQFLTTRISAVAEAKGLRAAYPEQLSGIFTTDEMAQAFDKKAYFAELDAQQKSEDQGYRNGYSDRGIGK